MRGGALDIVTGQKFRVREWDELLGDPNTYVSEFLYRGDIFTRSGNTVFKGSYKMYCGRILTVRAVDAHHRDWGDSDSRFLAKESEGVLWSPWMVELIDDTCSVDENLFLSCLLL